MGGGLRAAKPEELGTLLGWKDIAVGEGGTSGRPPPRPHTVSGLGDPQVFPTRDSFTASGECSKSFLLLTYKMSPGAEYTARSRVCKRAPYSRP